jgi:hypothetical protein
LAFQQRAGAVQFLLEFKERLAKFGLELHPDKTRLIEFGRYAARERKQRGDCKPETFTFLGLTHYCGRRHKTETFIHNSGWCSTQSALPDLPDGHGTVPLQI